MPFTFARCLGGALALAILAGCANSFIHEPLPGNYTLDPETTPLTFTSTTGADAVKLRIVSNAALTVVQVFDAEDCKGAYAGILSAQRKEPAPQVGMNYPASTPQGSYVEVGLEPRRDYVLRISFGSTAQLIDYRFNLKALPASEFELEIKAGTDGSEGGAADYGALDFKSVKRIDGRNLNAQVGAEYRGLPSCAQANPLFAQALKPRPDSPRRQVLIDLAMEAHFERWAPVGMENVPGVDEMIAKDRAEMNVSLPDAYWAQRRHSAALLQQEAAQATAATQRNYESALRERLHSATDAALVKIIKSPETFFSMIRLNRPTRFMTAYSDDYRRQFGQVNARETQRVAALDEAYGVCALTPKCTRYWPSGLL